MVYSRPTQPAYYLNVIRERSQVGWGLYSILYVDQYRLLTVRFHCTGYSRTFGYTVMTYYLCGIGLIFCPTGLFLSSYGAPYWF